jgi:NADP-dependent 3-hydroxy acid dehydrogenase YdfG
VSQNPRLTAWRNKTVWVVGASTGIGAAFAEKLISQGARVAVSARRAEPLAAMAARNVSGKVLALPMDITHADAWQARLNELLNTWQRVDLAVFMAGDYKPMRAWEIDLKVARDMIDVNLMGFYNGLAALVPQLMQQGDGHISLVASVAGYRGLPKALVYGPTKSALINLAETLYLDLHPKGIGVSVVNPGFVKTPLTDQNDFKMPALITPEEAADEMLAGYAAGDFEIHFPKRFSRVMKALEHLPYGAYFAGVNKFVDKP